MKFDEAIENINVLSAFSTVYGISPTVVRDIISKLKQEYTPTIEMTNVQKDTIISLLDNSDISKDDWETLITDDSPELPEISYRQAILAYMNPETIKVVDE